MSRQRPPQTIQKAPLFTFLDVLTCTMGLLILLLVAIARQARIKSDDAVQTAQATAQVTQQDWDEVQQRLAAARNARSQQAEQLSRRRAELGAAEANVRRLRDELAELERARRLLEESLTAGSSTSEQGELASVRARIAELEASLKKALAAGSKTSYAIVPYEGPNQTRRRPIYIECRSDRIVLQPEGVELRERDFDGPLDNSNALASAIRAAEQQISRDGQGGEPYPFLIVRPDGVNAYYIARAALRSWGSEFGYELVDADWQLDYKAPDPALLAVESKAVEEARERAKYLGYVGTGIGGGSFNGVTRGRGGGFGGGDDDPPTRGHFRVGADGRMVREGGSSYSSVRPRTGGGRLSRYAEITGEKEGSPAETFGSQPGSPAPEGRESAGPSLPETALAPASATQQGEQASGEPSSLFAKPAPNGSRSGQSGGMPGQPSPDTAVASDQKGPTILPQKMFGQSQSAEAGSSLAESQGKNWALPDSSRGSTPVTRPISVQCLEDRLIILPDGPSGLGRRELPFAGQTNNVINGLVTVVWDRMEGWGIAGKGMYWRPELHVQTLPGGSVRVAELKLLLKDSGIVIVEKPAARTALRSR